MHNSQGKVTFSNSLILKWDLKSKVSFILSRYQAAKYLGYCLPNIYCMSATLCVYIYYFNSHKNPIRQVFTYPCLTHQETTLRRYVICLYSKDGQVMEVTFKYRAILTQQVELTLNHLAALSLLINQIQNSVYVLPGKYLSCESHQE